MWLVYAVFASVVWGLNYTLSERILRKVTFPTMLGVQMLVGSIIYLTSSWRFKLREDVATITQDKSLWLWVPAAIASASIANMFISLSIRAKNATLAGLIELTYPIFTVLFSWILFGESHLTPAVVIGAVMIFSGVLVISCF